VRQLHDEGAVLDGRVAVQVVVGDVSAATAFDMSVGLSLGGAKNSPSLKSWD
jgi:hypothetical protein